MRPASVHVQPTDFHGRDFQGKQEELHKKACMETFRIIFNFCVLNTFHMECKIEACCPYFIIATIVLFTFPLKILPISYLFFYLVSQSLAYFPPSLKSVASHRHSLATCLKPMVIDLWRLARLPIFHFSSIFFCIWDFGCLFNPRASPYLPKVCIARVTLSLESCAVKMSWS